MTATSGTNASAEKQLTRFLAKYSPSIARVVRGARAKLRRYLPGAVELIYDNYYALVIGFGPTDRPSEAILSIATYPNHVSVCFLNGVELADPERRLKGRRQPRAPHPPGGRGRSRRSGHSRADS